MAFALPHPDKYEKLGVFCPDFFFIFFFFSMKQIWCLINKAIDNNFPRFVFHLQICSFILTFYLPTFPSLTE